MKLGLIVALSVAAGCATFALAQQNGMMPSPLSGVGALPQFPQSRDDAISKARERFAMADRNHDGFLTRDELMPPPPPSPAAPPPPPPAPDRAQMFSAMDADKNGQISRAEFDAFRPPVQSRRVVVMRERRVMPDGPGGPGPRGMMFRGADMPFRMGFAAMDADRDGKISAAEAEQAAAMRFDRLDADHDRILTWAESWMGSRAVAMRPEPRGGRD